MPTCTFVSFRLGLTDGVSVVAANWAEVMRGLGFDVVTVAGEGPVDRLVPGLELDATAPPDRDDVEAALADADLVVVENLCTIPLNLPAARVVAGVLAGRPALLHHHDPPWQRAEWAHVTELPPHDPAWRHVTINELTRRQFAARGLAATTIYNGFDTRGRRRATATGPGPSWAWRPTELLVAHPVRAIPRKQVATALALAEAARRHLLAARPGRAGLRPRAGADPGRRPHPGHPPVVAPRSRPLRRPRRGGLPVLVGRLRQPTHRGRHRPAPGGGG